MNKQKELEKIAKEVEKCRICQKDSIGKAVFGEGNPDAKIMFVGEAPGKKEAATGRPFVGRSGQLLRKLIRSLGLDDIKDVYITSPVKYLPIYKTPKQKDIEHGKRYLLKQIKIIRPKIIVLLGNTAAKALLKQPISLLKDHGNVIKQNYQTYFLTLHPAAVIRFKKFMKFFQEDFQTLKGLVWELNPKAY